MFFLDGGERGIRLCAEGKRKVLYREEGGKVGQIHADRLGEKEATIVTAEKVAQGT